MKLILICLFVIFPLSAISMEKAQVIILKGKVTKLEPGETKAKPVKKGDWLIEDTSLVTHEKSFVKLRFADLSTMNVGAKSMVVINKMPENKANMVNLLKGMIKAEVKKDSKKETATKMLVRTRSAVMGVRGTKFQTMYNHANKRTSLVTVEGKVAMVRNIKKDESELIKEGKTISESQAEKVEELDKMFEGKAEVVEVSEGKYSGVAESIEKPTEPVKIAPEQYDAIAKSMDSKKRAQDVMKLQDGEKIATGQIDETSGKITPKAGGIVDFETGLYIAPEEDAKLDKSTGTYKAKKVGKVDPASGDYIPPKGIKIDPKKGFVVDQKEIAKVASAEQKEQLLSLANQMNQGVVKKQVTTVKQIEQQAPVVKKDPWGPKDHKISFQIRPYSNKLNVLNKDTDSTAEFFSSKASWNYLTWDQVWNDKWSSRLRVGGQEYVVDDSDLKLYNYGDDGDERNFFSFGVAYKWLPRLKVLVDFVNRDQFYVIPEQSDGVQVIWSEFRALDIGFEHDTLKWFGLDTSIRATLHLLPDGSAPKQYGDRGENTTFFGFLLEANGFYAFSKSLGLETGLFYERMSAENSDFEFIHSSYGASFNLVWDI